MDKNPLEQQQIKINVLREKLRANLGQLFDNPEKLNSKVDKFLSQLNSFKEAGLIFNKEEMIKGVMEGIKIKDREEFINYLFKVLEPITLLRVTQAKIFEKIEREITTSGDGNKKLSEVLYTNYSDENPKEVEIHLAPATELIKEKGIENFKKEVEVGLRKLAEIIRSNDRIEEVSATSWIVAKNPGLLKKLGFTIIGTLPEEDDNSAYFNEQGQKMPTAQTKMSRNDFLSRYGS
jgi:hypothetical protein